jgi:hypothetical protein
MEIAFMPICLFCKQSFVPDPRRRQQQRFCSTIACQKASKAFSQQRWLAKPENWDYWRGAENVMRVRAWREANPRYWKRMKKKHPTLRYKI